MRVRIAALTLSLCLGAWPSLRECQAANVLTNFDDSPQDTTQHWHGFELGPTLSFPVAGESASRQESGLTAGLSFTGKPNRNLGIGLDVAYHYWPVSDEFKDTFNELFRQGTWNTLELGGTGWRLNARHIAAHVKLAALADRVLRPWLQAGVGLYQLDPNTTGYSGDAGFFSVSIGPLRRSSHPGYHVTAGADVRSGAGTRLGFNASYHRVRCRKAYGSELRVFSVGCHALFGR